MSRKDYTAAAAVIKAAREDAETGPFVPAIKRAKLASIGDVATGLASMFAADNYNFDRSRFYAACGMDN